MTLIVLGVKCVWCLRHFISHIWLMKFATVLFLTVRGYLLAFTSCLAVYTFFTFGRLPMLTVWYSVFVGIIECHTIQNVCVCVYERFMCRRLDA